MSEEPSEMVFAANKTNKGKIASTLLEGLNTLRKEGSFCDVTLRVGEKTIRAHKNVLYVCSPYFMAMFSGRFTESNQKEVSIEEIDGDCLEMLIDYIYTGTLDLSSENVKDILLTASFLQISSAEQLCCKFVLDATNFENCFEYILFGGKNSIKSIVDAGIETAALCFPETFARSDYLEIEFDEFQQLVNKIKQRGYPEDLIFSFVTRWLHHSYETRKNQIGNVLELLDPALVSPEVLHSSEFVKTANPTFTAWTGGNNTNETARHVLVSRRIPTSRPLRIKLFSEDSHRLIKPLPDKIADGSYVCRGYYIYHQGGWTNDKELVAERYCYHPTRSEWTRFIPLQKERAYHRSCILNDRIYSVGGTNGARALPSVEFLDLNSGQSGFTNPLPLGKERAGLGLHENSIYVVGGSDRATYYKCIHRFDVREGVWQELAPSPHRAGATSCAILGDNIYTTHPDTLQRYDIRANDWSLISAQYKRYPPEVFALDNKLLGLFNDHIARFIPDGGRWENERTLKFNLPYVQVSPNLRFPNAYEENIPDPVFDGDYHPSDDESEMESSDDDGDL